MSTVRRTFDLDSDTDARLTALAAEKGQDAAAVVADAVDLLDSVVNIEGPDVEEDLRRFREFERTGEAVPWEEVKAWVESWGTPNEHPRPQPAVPCGAIASGFTGPSPPPGEVHLYEFTIKALGQNGAVLATAKAQRKFPQ